MSIPSRWWRWLLHRVWYVHPAQMLLIKTTPAVCVQLLARAAKPSAQRLDLRNLFMDGRRYYVDPDEAGFRMRSTTRIPWRRGRTRAATILYGACHELEPGVTRIELRARMTLTFFFDVFLLPGWMSLLLIFGPLPQSAGIIASLALLVLSWLWHRYTAMMQAIDMVYFMQVVLSDLPEVTVAQLPPVADNTIYADFAEQWQKFYKQQSQ
jgi:hypothetical protein